MERIFARILAIFDNFWVVSASFWPIYVLKTHIYEGNIGNHHMTYMVGTKPKTMIYTTERIFYLFVLLQNTCLCGTNTHFHYAIVLSRYITWYKVSVNYFRRGITE